MISTASKASHRIRKAVRLPRKHSENPLRVLFYNHCFGIPSRKLVSSARLHASVFFLRKYGRVKNPSIAPTIALIRDARPDILTIAEVFGRKQRLSLITALKRLGFRSFHSGFGIRLKSGDHVEVLLATREKSTSLSVPSIDHSPNLPGCGGGVVAAMMGKGTLVIGLHAALRRIPRTRRVWQRQMQAIEQIVREHPAKRMILLGDFNLVPKHFPPFLRSLGRYSSLDPTCSTTPIIRLVYRRPIDHILGHGFDVISSTVKRGESDHRAVIVELVPSFPESFRNCRGNRAKSSP